MCDLEKMKDLTKDIIETLNTEEENKNKETDNEENKADDENIDKPNFSFMGMKPIDVAKFLIDDSYTVYGVFLFPQVKKKVFTIDDLREIAEYLTTYCNHNHDKTDLLEEFGKMLIQSKDKIL